MKCQLKLSAILPFFSFFFLACGDVRTDREIWESKNISDYHTTVSVKCFCSYPDPFVVHIKNDTIVSIADIQSEINYKLTDSSLCTINGLFDLIEYAVTRKADVLKVEYDLLYHYPKKIEIDYYRKTIDDEITIAMSHFAVDP